MTRLTELDVPPTWEATVIEAFGGAPPVSGRAMRVGVAFALVALWLAAAAGAWLISH